MQRFAAAALFSLLISMAAAGHSTQPPCGSKEAAQFDFWLGSWDLEWKSPGGEAQRGSNTISKVLDNCVVFESFDGGDKLPLKGYSHSLYDVKARKWKQTWVDNQGAYLDFTGEFKDGKMTLWREFVNPDGKKIMQRMVFYNIGKDALDWNWENSTDDGKTWNVLWKIAYKRRAE